MLNELWSSLRFRVVSLWVFGVAKCAVWVSAVEAEKYSVGHAIEIDRKLILPSYSEIDHSRPVEVPIAESIMVR